MSLIHRALERSIVAAASFGLFVVLMATARAADDDGWISLFDGKTLNGWHKNPQRIGHGTGGQWTVEDGAIVGQQDPPGSGNGGILLTDRKFGDFELLIDMKPGWGGDSGVFLRSNDRGQCFQMMVDYHNDGNVGHIYGEGIGGFNNRPFIFDGVMEGEKLKALKMKDSGLKVPKAYSCSAEEWLKAWKIDDWNTARIRVEGKDAKITTWINGLKVSEFDGTTFDGTGYDKEKVRAALGTEGSIAVQVHGGKSWPKGATCQWKNIKIKPLK